MGVAIFMTETRAAKELGISAITLKRIAQRGEIGYRYIGARRRYTTADLEEYTEGRRVCPTDSKSETTGSVNDQAASSGTGAGISQEKGTGVDAPNVHHLAQTTFKKPNSS